MRNQPSGRPLADAWRARDIMSREFRSISPDSSVEIASRFISDSKDPCFLVGNNRTYSGLVTRDRIEQALQSGMGETSVASLLISDAAHVHPDHSVELVLKRLAEDPGLLPVLSRMDVHLLEGVITPQTLIDFLQRAVQGTSMGQTEFT